MAVQRSGGGVEVDQGGDGEHAADGVEDALRGGAGFSEVGVEDWFSFGGEVGRDDGAGGVREAVALGGGGGAEDEVREGVRFTGGVEHVEKGVGEFAACTEVTAEVQVVSAKQFGFGVPEEGAVGDGEGTGASGARLIVVFEEQESGATEQRAGEGGVLVGLEHFGEDACVAGDDEGAEPEVTMWLEEDVFAEEPNDAVGDAGGVDDAVAPVVNGVAGREGAFPGCGQCVGGVGRVEIGAELWIVGDE